MTGFNRVPERDISAATGCGATPLPPPQPHPSGSLGYTTGNQERMQTGTQFPTLPKAIFREESWILHGKISSFKESPRPPD